MSRSIQLVLLCVVTLSYIQLGRAQNDAHNVSEAVLEVLLPVMKEIKKDIISVKRELTSLNETVNKLSGDLEQHKNQTASVLADLQSSINKSHTEQLNLFHDEMESILTEKLTHIEDRLVNQLDDLDSKLVSVNTTSELMRGDLRSVKRKLNLLDETVSHLSGDIEQHKNQTASVLADLQSLDSQLAAVNTSMTEDITSLENELNAKLDEQTESITADLKSLINMSHTELLNLIHNDMEFELMTNNKTSVEDKLESEIKQNCTHQVNNSDENTPPLPIHTCNGTGGWRRAVYLDMTDPNTNCPEGWNMTDYSKRTCGRATNRSLTCDSVTFSVRGGEYSQVCGRIRAYQWGRPTGFYGSRRYPSVNEAYFNGVAVMHGSPRQHIWTFVAGIGENYPGGANLYLCPCDGIRSSLLTIPPFVGEDYFCESGYIYPGQWTPNELYTFHSNDTLWDGRDCHSSSTCCSLHNPPYFTKTLNTPTTCTDDIELRMCHHWDMRYENTAVELVELYVK